MATTRKVLGRGTVFGRGENRALRSALRALKASRKLSQDAIGRLLGIAQQNAGRLLKTDDAGFSFRTAQRLVHELGFADVEAFFKAKGLRAAAPPNDRRASA